MGTAVDIQPTLESDLERDGFVVIRQAFSAEELSVMSDCFDRLVQRAAGLTHTRMIDGSQFVADLDDAGIQRIHRVVWCGAAEASLLSIGRDPRVLDIVRLFLRSRTFDHLINQAHFKYPGDGVSFPWHQDAIHRRYGTELWNDVNGTGSFVQIAIAVDEMTLQNGPLQLVRGSHKNGFIPVDAERNLPEGTVQESEVVSLEMQPGDIVAWGPYLIHGSKPNTGDKPRRLFINGFSSPGANKRIYPGDGSGQRIVDRRR